MSEKLSPFDYIKTILNTGEQLDIAGYNPFMVNRGLSFYKDCVFYANEMNRHGGLDLDMQYNFLNGVVKKHKRNYSKWEKADKKDEDISAVCETFKVNRRRALEIIRTLNNDNLEQIKESLYKGGRG
jgi:hypothetical protein